MHHFLQLAFVLTQLIHLGRSIRSYGLVAGISQWDRAGEPAFSWKHRRCRYQHHSGVVVVVPGTVTTSRHTDRVIVESGDLTLKSQEVLAENARPEAHK